MPENIGEATVLVIPDLTGFIKELRAKLKVAIAEVEGTNPPKIRIAPAISRNFVGELRRQVNAAVAQAQTGVKPITVRAQIAPLPQGQLREVQQASIGQTRVTRPRPQPVETQPQLAPALTAATTAGNQFAATQERMNALIAQGAILIGQETVALQRNTQERVGGAAAGVGAAVKQTEAERLLARARRNIAAIDFTALGTAERATAILTARNALIRTAVVAEEQHATAVSATARALAGEVTALERANAALLEESAASDKAARSQARNASRAARSQEQLRRGAAATSLSFLGVRGATLAASGSFLAGAAAIGVLARTLQEATDFATQLSVFRATTGATADQLERVGAAARALGADITLPGVAASDAAVAV